MTLMERRRALMMPHDKKGPVAVYNKGVISPEAGDFVKNGYNKTSGTFTKQGAYLYLYARREGGRAPVAVSCASTKAIDLSKFDTIRIVAKNGSNASLPSEGNFCLVIADSVVNGTSITDAYGDSSEHRRFVISDAGDFERSITIPSERKKQQFLSLYAESWTVSKTMTFNIYEIWLE